MFAAFASHDRDAVTAMRLAWSAEQPPDGSRALVVASVDGLFVMMTPLAPRAIAGEGGEIIAVRTGGAARADTRRDREPHGADAASGLFRIARTYRRAGLDTLRYDVGQSCVVVWHAPDAELLAIRDPLGAAELYHAAHRNGLLVADTLDAFEHDERCRLEYIADFAASRGLRTTGTIRPNVQALTPGSAIRWRSGRVSCDVYWSPERVVPRPRLGMADAVDQYRTLLQSAVRHHVDAGRTTWAHLSGGLDSSSVVSVSSDLAERGESAGALGGTITNTESFGNGDESPFVDAVLERYELENVRIADEWPWRRDGGAMPRTDHPTAGYPFFARARVMTALMKAAGATSLLTGVGPDHYLAQTSAYLPDLFWRLRLGEGAREAYRWSLVLDSSIWQVGARHALLPLVSRRLHQAVTCRATDLPDWWADGFVRRYDLRRRQALDDTLSGRRGDLYAATAARGVSELGCWVPRWRVHDGVEVRHPLLDLPLVEFALSLPYTLRTDVPQSKPVFRAAVKGILPDKVRLRRTKGQTTARLAWAFRHERASLERLVANSVLADLGCIEPGKLLAAVRSPNPGAHTSFLYATLALETWLSVRSGRFTVNDN